MDPVEKAYQLGQDAGGRAGQGAVRYISIDTVGLLRHALELDGRVDGIARLRHATLMLRTPLLRDPEAGSAASLVQAADDSLASAQGVLESGSRQTKGLVSAFLRVERSMPGRRMPKQYWDQLVAGATPQTWEAEYDLAKSALDLVYGSGAARRLVGLTKDASTIAEMLGLAHGGTRAISERLLKAQLDAMPKGAMERYFKGLGLPQKDARRMASAWRWGRASTIAELTAIIENPKQKMALYQGLASGSIRLGVALTPGQIAQALRGVDLPGVGALRGAAGAGGRAADRIAVAIANQTAREVLGNLLIAHDISTLLFDPSDTNRAVAGISLGGVALAGAAATSGLAGALVPGPGWIYLGGSVVAAVGLTATGVYYDVQVEQALKDTYESSYKSAAIVAYHEQLAADADRQIVIEAGRTSSAPAAVSKINAWRPAGTHFPPHAVLSTSARTAG